MVETLKVIGRKLKQSIHSTFMVSVEAYKSFEESHASQAAASLAYYALFSLFPLLLLIISIGGFILENKTVYRIVVAITYQVLPVSEALIEGNLQQILDIRGPLGVISILTILWSASGVFRVLVTNINLAWPEAKQHNFLRQSSLAFGMVGVLFGLFGLALLATLASDVLQRLEIPLLGDVTVYETLNWSLLSRYIPRLILFVLFLLLYRRVPNVEVKWRAAILSALLATAAWAVATRVFTWYLESGLGRYEVTYGSLGTVVAWMVLIYNGSWIVLYGSHLSAAIQRYLQGK